MNDEHPYTPIIGAIVVGLIVGFFLGTMIVWGRPVVKKEVTEVKCDKTQLELDVQSARFLCNGNVADFHYDDNGKGEKVSPIIKCED